MQRIIDAVGVDSAGKPNSNVIVVSDHGIDIFHTAVNMTAFLASQGFDPARVRAVTSGPAVNLYINPGREPNGTVSQTEYRALQQTLVSALKAFVDTNPSYTQGATQVPVFDKVFSRPLPDDPNDPSFGLGTTSPLARTPATSLRHFSRSATTRRHSDPSRAASATPLLLVRQFSVPNFYGAHGYDPSYGT